MVEHANVASNNIHEPKGAAAASANTCYVADGAGSGSFTTVPAAAISGVNNLNIYPVEIFISDISTAASKFVVCPLAGEITKAYTVLNDSITTADATVSIEIAGTAVTNGNIVVASGSSAGTVDSSTPSANNTVTAGQAIEIITDGGSTGTASAMVTLLVDVS